VLYVYDHRLILRRRSTFEESAPGRALYRHILGRQRFEMLVLMPAGLAYSGIAYALVTARPDRATMLAVIQLLFTMGFVISFVRNFSRRQRLISACAVGETDA